MTNKKKPGRPAKAEATLDPRYVTKDYLDEQLGKILEAVKPQAPITPTLDTQPDQNVPAVAQPVIVNTNAMPLPIEWGNYIDKKLGKDFKRDLVLQDSGMKIKIYVPKDVSNASDTHWVNYKQDLRAKPIDPREGFSGLQKYVDLVAQNLKLSEVMVAQRATQIS